MPRSIPRSCATEAGGVKQYVTFLRKGVVGVDAKSRQAPLAVRKTIDPGANIMTPVAYRDQVFVSTSRGGAALLELKGDGDKVQPKEVYFSKTIGASIGSAVLLDGHLYGSTGQGLFCAEFATGKEKWVEKPIGNASICFADGRLYVRSALQRRRGAGRGRTRRSTSRRAASSSPNARRRPPGRTRSSPTAASTSATWTCSFAGR